MAAAGPPGPPGGALRINIPRVPLHEIYIPPRVPGQYPIPGAPGHYAVRLQNGGIIRITSNLERLPYGIGRDDDRREGVATPSTERLGDNTTPSTLSATNSDQSTENPVVSSSIESRQTEDPSSSVRTMDPESSSRTKRRRKSRKYLKKISKKSIRKNKKSIRN